MHANEIAISLDLVRQLIATQFPAFADLQVTRFSSAGTDNAIYRLGDNLMARLPLTPEAAGRVLKEHEYLPQLAPLLPLEIPTPLALGQATPEYPVSWSIYPWIAGENAQGEVLAHPEETARKLAEFIKALHQIDARGGPLPGSHNFYRGVPLAKLDAETRGAIKMLQDEFDSAAITAVWEHALHTPRWEQAPVWIHGDLLPSNLLFKQGHLTAVIDFGGLTIGDPACDLITAWSLFNAKEREFFRQQLNVDDATWARGRGWALSIGLIAFPYYKTSNPAFAKTALRMIQETLRED